MCTTQSFKELSEKLSEWLNYEFKVEKLNRNNDDKKFVIRDNDIKEYSEENRHTELIFRIENESLVINHFYLKEIGKGYGSKIIQWFMDFAKDRNFKTIEIRAVGDDKVEMHHLLRKFNFRVRNTYSEGKNYILKIS